MSREDVPRTEEQKERRNELERQRRRNNPEEVRAEFRAYYSADATRNRKLKERYGIDAAEVERMIDAQGGVCALCQRPIHTDARRRVHVDHDHETGKIRGILCARCNMALGAFGDNEAGLLRALSYVRGELK